MRKLRMSAFAGIIAFVLYIPLLILTDYIPAPPEYDLFMLILFFLATASFAIFIWGFAVIASKTRNTLLEKTIHVALIFILTLFLPFILPSDLAYDLNSLIVNILNTIIFPLSVLLFVLFAFGLLRIRKKIGINATLTTLAAFLSVGGLLIGWYLTLMDIGYGFYTSEDVYIAFSGSTTAFHIFSVTLTLFCIFGVLTLFKASHVFEKQAKRK